MNQQNGENNQIGLAMKAETNSGDIKKRQKSSIQRRRLPAELINELFASLPIKIAFGLLAKLPNGLLDRNVRKMLKSIKEAMKANKWNADDCGWDMTVSEDGLIATNSAAIRVMASVRAILPFPNVELNYCTSKPHIAFYFEVRVLVLPTPMRGVSFYIGLCDKQYPMMGNWLGEEDNSIAIENKKGIYVECDFIKFEKANVENEDPEFYEGDVVGLGLINSPADSALKCFASCNGQFLGSIELPEKFLALELYPAASLFLVGDSIRANFGMEEWSYNPIQLVD